MTNIIRSPDDRFAMGDINTPVVVSAGDSTSGLTVPVRNTAPLATDPGLLVRVVSQPAGGAATDVTDRVGRLLGIVASITATVITDPIDRVARLLGVAKIVDTAGVNQLVITAANAAKVDGSAVTQPVSIAAAVDVSDRAARLLGVTKVVDTAGVNQLIVTAANAAKVDGSAVTQPISAATLPLPTGAATAANQLPAGHTVKLLDTAGVNQAIVTAANALKVDGSAVTQPVSGTVTANQGTPAVTANRWPVQITDGTNLATVTAGGLLNVSAAAAPAADTVGTTVALNIVNAAATVVIAGQGSVGFFLAAGTLIGTIVPEISYDGGTTWVAGYFVDPITAVMTQSIVFAVANTVQSTSILLPGGASNARVRVSVFTSGTANATLRAVGQKDRHVLDTGAVSTAAPTYVAGTDAPLSLTTAGAIRTDSSGVTQPVSIAAAIDVSDRAARLLGVSKIVDTAGVNQLIVTAANAAKVDGSAVTQPVSIAAAVDVSDRIARLVGVVRGEQADNAVNPTTKVPTVPVRANAAAPAWTEGNVAPLSADLSGNTRVVVVPALPTGANTIGVVNQGTAGAAAWLVDVTDRVARLIGSIRTYTADTTFTRGTATGPAAGGVIATITPGAGTYEVSVNSYYGGTIDVLDNMQLQVGATVIGTLQVNLIANNADPHSDQRFPRLTVPAATAVTVNAILAGAAGSIYIATIMLTPVVA